MPDYRRIYADGGTYLLNVCLDDRRSDLLVRHIAALRASWRAAAAARPFETVAAVVLPDHLHCIWRLPEEDHDFSARMAQLKSGSTRRLPEGLKRHGRKRERGMRQSRFWEHLIRDGEDLERHVDYVHFNPVKHGYVSDPDDWRYSTWGKWKREFGRPINTRPEDWQPPHLGERKELAG